MQTTFSALFALFALGGGLAAQADEEAVFTISGKKNGTVTIVDHKQPGSKPETIEPMTLNRASETAVEKYRATRNAQLEADQMSRNPLEEPAKTAAPEEAEIENSSPDAPIDVQKGLERLRERNWITYTSDDKHFPESVFNPVTKEFMPTLEAIKSLEQPERPWTGPIPPPPGPREPSVAGSGGSISGKAN